MSGGSARASRPSSDTHTRVGGETLVQLPVPDIDGEHAPRAAFEQHVGEAAGGGADIEADEAFRLEPECVERRGELHPAARHVGVRRRGLDCCVEGHLLGRLFERHAADTDEPRCDRGLRARPAGKEAALDENDIRALAHRALRLEGWRRL